MGFRGEFRIENPISQKEPIKLAVNSVANIIMGPASVYAGAQGLTIPTPMPAATTINVSPQASAGWTDVGGTDGGVTFEVSPKFSPLNVDQIVDTIDERLTSRTIMVTTTLAESTLQNLALSLNTTVGATGTNYASFNPAFDAFTSQVGKFSLIVDGFAPATVANARRRIYLPRVQQTGAIKPVYEKTKQVGFAVQFTAYYVSATVPPFTVVDQTA